MGGEVIINLARVGGGRSCLTLRGEGWKGAGFTTLWGEVEGETLACTHLPLIRIYHMHYMQFK